LIFFESETFKKSFFLIQIFGEEIRCFFLFFSFYDLTSEFLSEEQQLLINHLTESDKRVHFTNHQCEESEEHQVDKKTDENHTKRQDHKKKETRI